MLVWGAGIKGAERKKEAGVKTNQPINLKELEKANSRPKLRHCESSLRKVSTCSDLREGCPPYRRKRLAS